MSDNDLIRRGDALRIMSDGDDIVGPDYPEWFINRYAAIDAIPAAQPTVKPLVWEGEEGKSYRQANSIIGQYQVTWLGEFECWQLSRPHCHGDEWGNGFSRHSRKDEAKAAAQADYKARILSALNMQPTVSPDVAELVTLLARAKEELRMIRMKDSGAVYDVLLRTELDAALARVKGVM